MDEALSGGETGAGVTSLIMENVCSRETTRRRERKVEKPLKSNTKCVYIYERLYTTCMYVISIFICF